MWESPFLPFCGIQDAMDGTKDLSFGQEVPKYFDFQMEHPANYIMSLVSRLPITKLSLGFRPIWITRESYEEVRPPIILNVGHGIPGVLVHIS